MGLRPFKGEKQGRRKDKLAKKPADFDRDMCTGRVSPDLGHKPKPEGFYSGSFSASGLC